MKPLRVCAEDGCTVLVERGACAKHTVDGKGQRYRPYSGWRWTKLRKAVLREEPWCQIQGPECTRVATEVDHILALQDGGAMYDRANLQSVCHTCHVNKPKMPVFRSERPQDPGITRNVERAERGKQMIRDGASDEEVVAATGANPSSVSRWRGMVSR